LSQYGQFCPVAKVTELLGEKWMLLILRELLLGSSRYNEFQRALSRISPTLLTKRLKQLENAGIILRKKQIFTYTCRQRVVSYRRTHGDLGNAMGTWAT